MPDTMISVLGGRSTSTIAALREAKIDFAVGPLPTDQSVSDLRTEQLFSSDLASSCAAATRPRMRATWAAWRLTAGFTACSSRASRPSSH
jgi:DNA-binding transcriptional LysR family regulator